MVSPGMHSHAEHGNEEFSPTIMSRQIGAILLAAGFSRRFSSSPLGSSPLGSSPLGSSKLLTPLRNGNTVFGQSLDRIAAAIPSILVVTRPEIAAQLDNVATKAEIAIFDQADRGMGASLAFASSRIGDWAGCLVCLADMPFISIESYRLIADTLTADSIITPNFNSTAGNPVAFGAQFFSELASLDGDCGGKSILKAHPEAVKRLALNDPGILQDVDTSADLARYQ